MELYWKAAAAALMAAVLGQTVGRQEKDLATLLNIAACVLVAMAGLCYLQGVLQYLWELEASCALPGELLGILLRAAGVGLGCELIGMLCSDAGAGSLGKAVQMLSSSAVLYLSIPVFQMFFALIQDILGAL